MQKALMGGNSTASQSSTRHNSVGSITTTSSGSSPRSRTSSLASENSSTGSTSRQSSNIERLSSHQEESGSQDYSKVNGTTTTNSDVVASQSSGKRTRGSSVKSQDINSNEVVSTISKDSNVDTFSNSSSLQEVVPKSNENSVAQDTEVENEGSEGKPAFVKEIADFEVYEGDSGRFDVHIDSEQDKDFKVTWLKDDAEIAQNRRKYKVEQSSNGRCSLIIKNCEENDDAQYTCKVSNKFGSISCSAELFVEGIFGTTSGTSC